MNPDDSQRDGDSLGGDTALAAVASPGDLARGLAAWLEWQRAAGLDAVEGTLPAPVVHRPGRSARHPPPRAGRPPGQARAQAAASKLPKEAPARSASRQPFPAPHTGYDKTLVLPPDSPVDPASIVRGAEGLEAVRAILGECKRCRLHEGRRHIVFGEGNPQAELMFVGEGPGANEDRLGRPFVGRAGQLLDRMIAAMGFAREEVYIANVVKCRPPRNREPSPDEVLACRPFLVGQIAAIRPKVIVALGAVAARTLLQVRASISRLRARWHVVRVPDVGAVDVMATFHPAFLLRNPEMKRHAWEDLKAVLARLGRSPPPRRPRR